MSKLIFHNVTIPKRVQTQGGGQLNKSKANKYELQVFYYQPKKDGKQVMRKRRFFIGKEGNVDAMDFFAEGTDGKVFNQIWDKVGVSRGKKFTLGDPNFSLDMYKKNASFLNKRFWQQNLLNKSPNMMDNLNMVLTALQTPEYGEIHLPCKNAELPPKISKEYIRKFFEKESTGKSVAKKKTQAAVQVDEVKPKQE